ncbi:MAG: DNA methyltransferase [bacterium]
MPFLQKDEDGIIVKQGQFWSQKQRQEHSMHYIVPYQACFPPQLPKYFIQNYSKQKEIVLDPFCGRGTTVLEANQLERIGYGADISPLAIHISRTKLNNISLIEVQQRLQSINFKQKCLYEYERFIDIYHPDTYSQIMNLKKQLKCNPIDNFIKTIILGRLHGHTPAFFSVWTFNVISFSIEKIRKQSQMKGLKPKFRDVVPRILSKAEAVLKNPIKEQPESKVLYCDSRKLTISDNCVDLIVTSPPFLDLVNYLDDNWLRFWFLGINIDKYMGKIVQSTSLKEYGDFLFDSLKEMYRVLKPGKYCIVEVGDVNYYGKKVYLDELVNKLASVVGFNIEKILINEITQPNISKEFRRKPPGQGTKTNRCVVMRKPSQLV